MSHHTRPLSVLSRAGTTCIKNWFKDAVRCGDSDGLVLPQNYITINLLSYCLIIAYTAACHGTEQRPERAMALYTRVHVNWLPDLLVTGAEVNGQAGKKGSTAATPWGVLYQLQKRPQWLKRRISPNRVNVFVKGVTLPGRSVVSRTGRD
jgi:hypothetical protein